MGEDEEIKSIASEMIRMLESGASLEDVKKKGSELKKFVRE